MEIDLNKLRDHAYKTACEHGFHDKEHSDKHWLMLVISEIGEAINAESRECFKRLRALTIRMYHIDEANSGEL